MTLKHENLLNLVGMLYEAKKESVKTLREMETILALVEIPMFREKLPEDILKELHKGEKGLAKQRLVLAGMIKLIENLGEVFPDFIKVWETEEGYEKIKILFDKEKAYSQKERDIAYQLALYVSQNQDWLSRVDMSQPTFSLDNYMKKYEEHHAGKPGKDDE